jgi:hypothetical protein
MPSPTTAAEGLLADMRQFILDQAHGRTDETAERYRQVADDLVEFVAGVDVAPYLGPELARRLVAERSRSGADALLGSLGLVSFVRVLPAFLAEPWLPAVGKPRVTRRTAVRRLLTFLRMRLKEDGCLRREDIQAVEKALGSARHESYSDPARPRSGTVRCSVTVDLEQHLVDQVLRDVTDGRHETFDEAIAARLNPVQVTYWSYPDREDGLHHPRGW